MFKRILVVCSVLALVSVTPAFAQDQAALEKKVADLQLTVAKLQSTAGRVAVIDMQKIAQAMRRDVAMQQEVEANRIALRQRLTERQSQLQAQVNEAQSKLGPSPSNEQKQELLTLAASARQEMDQLKVTAQQEDERFRKVVWSKFSDDVRPAVEKIAAREAYSIVAIRNDTLLVVGPSVDLTDAVISAMLAAAPASTQPAPNPMSIPDVP